MNFGVNFGVIERDAQQLMEVFGALGEGGGGGGEEGQQGTHQAGRERWVVEREVVEVVGGPAAGRGVEAEQERAEQCAGGGQRQPSQHFDGGHVVRESGREQSERSLGEL